MLCVLAVVVGILAIGIVSASADVPTTVLDVKSGDKVTYKLSLSGVPEKIVGCDFSVYYDSSAFKLESVADFNDSTNAEDWSATINPDLDGEVRGNWSILKGVNFSKKRNIVTLNLTATKDAKAHISYFVRYMYDNTVFDSDERPQIDQYMFTCDVTKNGEAVVQDAQPELNVEEEQPNGLFENSRTGKSEDADKALTGDSIKANGGALDDAGSGSGSGSGSGNNSGNQSGNNNGNNSGNGSGSGSGNNSGNGGNSGSTTANGAGSANKNAASEGSTLSGQKANTPNTSATEVEEEDETDADGKVIAKSNSDSDSGDKKDSGSSSGLMWFIIIAVIVIAGGCIAYIVVKGKKKTDDESVS